MARSQQYDLLRAAGIGKGAKKIVRKIKSPLDAAMREFDSFEVGLGQLPLFPSVPGQYPIQRAPAPRIPLSRPRSALEIQTQAQAQEKPGIVEQILKPITQIAVLGIGAIVFVNVIPPVLDYLSKARPKRE